LILRSIGWYGCAYDGLAVGFRTYGGGWVYHMADGWSVWGFVIGLDYENPYL